MAKLALRKYVAEMAEDWGITCEVRFHNGGGSTAWCFNGDDDRLQGLIRFGVGWGGALTWTRVGYSENLKQAQHLVRGHRKGKRALRYLAAHEFAHVLNDVLHPYGKPAHGEEWRMVYEHLLSGHMPGYDRSSNGKNKA